jgi:TonB family protein
LGSTSLARKLEVVPCQPGGPTVKIQDGIVPPSVIFKVEPTYTTAARDSKFQGTILVSVVVSTDGHPRWPKVVKAVGYGLDEQAIEAVQQWRFHPASKGGCAVPVYAQIEVTFRLDSGALSLNQAGMEGRKGRAPAQRQLGIAYFQGTDVVQDYREAEKWFRLAAEQGDAIAADYLALMSTTGQGVAKSHWEAVKWYRIAADQGDIVAQARLGEAYTKGLGVPQDYVQAHMWLNLAAAQGNESAAKARDQLAQSMTPAQVAEAQSMARDWKATPKASQD